FPRAKVIHCLRDPIDTCLSSYFQNFGTNVPFSRDLAQLGKQYRAYQEVMDHWYEVLDLEFLPSRYEELVADPEPKARALVEHLGIGFDEACLRFHESKKHVGTASSVQVRRPIYQTSRQRWRNYEQHLGPLLDQLGDLAQV
ncbi:MAG: sulfotransferase, partial [Phycisphaerales bacterium]|nr:sulfotransferase [Phycisphaerales bacterium]